MSFIHDALLGGIRRIFVAGTEQPNKGAIEFSNATATVLSDRVQVTVAPAASVTSSGGTVITLIPDGVPGTIEDYKLYAGTTINATPSVIASYNIADNSVLVFDVRATAFVTSGASAGNVESFQLSAKVKRVSGTVSAMIPLITLIQAGEESTLDLTLSSNDTTKAVDFQVTGLASNTIKWVIEAKVLVFTP
jgi:hypothetical protein